MKTASGIVLAMMLAGAAQAQTGPGVVIMRKVLHSDVTPTPTPTPGSSTPTPTPPPKPGDPGYYSWVVTPWVQPGTCGQQIVQTRDVSCQQTGGKVVEDILCLRDGSGEKPPSSEAVENTQACRYAWDLTPWSVQPGCGNTLETRTVTCLRSDGTAMPDASCGKTPPPAQQTVKDYSACTFGWNVSDWSAPTTVCGEITQTRQVACQRSDGLAQAESVCLAIAPKPDASQTVLITTGCENSWQTGPWSSPAPACGATVSSRTVQCVSKSGTVVADSQCVGKRPADSQPATDYSTCTFNWRIGDWGPASTHCGAGTRTRPVDCVAQQDGSVVDGSRCTAAKPEASEGTFEISSCTYAWQVRSDYGAPVPACGSTVRQRQVACVRSDGTEVPGTLCPQDGIPDSTQPATDYSACTYRWQIGAWSAPSTTCGAATQTRTVSCTRSDGSAADDSLCGARPDTVQSTYQTEGCGISWQTGAWQGTGCGAITQTRSVSCYRSDGQTLDDAQCAPYGAKPAVTQDVTNYAACTYDWSIGSWGTPTTTCGKGTQTRSVACLRSDGQIAADSSCAGTRPADTQDTERYDGCTFKWVAGNWGAAAPACGTSTHSRTVTCQRSDGTTVDGSQCDAGSKPATSEPIADYSTCSYSWTATNWSAVTGCTDSAGQTRTVTCTRSDASSTAVADSFCTTAKPASTQTVSAYDQCSYAWVTGQWSAYDSTCSKNATRTRTVQCQATSKEGTTVTDASGAKCTATKPASTDSTSITTGCGYTGITCSTPTANKASSAATIAQLGAATSAAAAATLCTNWGTANKQTTGVCIWDGSKAYYNGGQVIAYQGIYYASTCTANAPF